MVDDFAWASGGMAYTTDLKSVGPWAMRVRLPLCPCDIKDCNRNYYLLLLRAVSSAWLERLLDMQEVTGSSPVPPTSIQ